VEHQARPPSGGRGRSARSGRLGQHPCGPMRVSWCFPRPRHPAPSAPVRGSVPLRRPARASGLERRGRNAPVGVSRRTGTAAPGGASRRVRPRGRHAAAVRRRPSAASTRRTACGSVTAPRIRRGPPQRSQTSTWIANTRRRSRAQVQRFGERAPASAPASSDAGVGTSADRHWARGARTPG
jgi:hypothetical protein